MRPIDLILLLLFSGVLLLLGFLLFRRSRPKAPSAADGAPFGTQDLDLLEKALDLIPNLTLAAYIAALVRRKARYPLTAHSDFLSIAAGRALRFKGRHLTMQEAERFLPKEFFPIETEQQLLVRLLVAFQRGDAFHDEERRQQAAAASLVAGRKVTLLPTPEWKPELV
jgi:hypothetical protein